jgi:hypothetical protein
MTTEHDEWVARIGYGGFPVLATIRQRPDGSYYMRRTGDRDAIRPLTESDRLLDRSLSSPTVLPSGITLPERSDDAATAGAAIATVLARSRGPPTKQNRPPGSAPGGRSVFGCSPKNRKDGCHDYHTKAGRCKRWR